MREEKSISFIPTFARIIKNMFLSSPLLMTLFILFDLLHAAAYVLVIIFTQHFFDSVLVFSNGGTLSQVLWPLLGFGGSIIFLEIANGLSNFNTEYPSPKILGNMFKRLYEKAAKIATEDYESPELLNLINKAETGVEGSYLSASFILAFFTFYLPYFVFMGIYLQSLSPFLIVLLVLIFIPVICGHLIRFKLFSKVENKIASERRAMDYYDKVIGDREYLKETRMLGAVHYFIELYKKATARVNQEKSNAEIRHAKLELLLRILTVLGYVGILLLIVENLLTGKITAGSFAAIFASINTMFDLSEEVFGGLMGRISRHAATICNYQKLLDWPANHRMNNTIDPEGKIVFRDVQYRYPNAEKDALASVTFHINPGETIAIVGQNGAGKSTLTKLILGLYEPSSGEILRPQIGFSGVSAVFQNFQKYQMTLEENIMISDTLIKSSIQEKMQDVCNQADLDMNQSLFPDGYKTMLSREFGGTDVSGGQWQRIAIARGLFREHETMILDEPTAAIDPYEETHLYRNFSQISKDKTAIIVTHRLGSTQIADRIIVMNNGTIDDIGTHDQLMERTGLYYSMYQEQAKWYKDHPESVH